MSKRYHQVRLLVMVTVLILLSPFPGRGQHTAALKAHTFRTIDGVYTVGFEQSLSKHLSAEFSLQGGHYIDIRPNRFEDYKVTGVGAIGALRYYPFTKKVAAPRGFFGYGALRYIDFTEAFLYTVSGDQYKVGGNMLNVGLGVGYKFVYRRFGLEGFVGWGVGRLKSDDGNYRNNIPDYYRKAIEEQEHFPQLDLALCYMFSPF